MRTRVLFPRHVQPVNDIRTFWVTNKHLRIIPFFFVTPLPPAQGDSYGAGTTAPDVPSKPSQAFVLFR